MLDASKSLETAALTHLRDNCAFTFDGGSNSFSAEELPFYPHTYLCRLTLEAGAVLKSGRKRKQALIEDAEFRFLFQPTLGDSRLVPLANDRSNILLANRWFGLKIRGDKERMSYARFYYSVCRVERQGEAHNVPDTVANVRFAPVATSEQKSSVTGAMWRFMDAKARTSLAVKFEERGSFQWRRYRANVPAQLGDTLFDLEMKIWRRNGHITYNKSMPIFQSPALEAVPLPKLGKISLPGYVRWHEKLRFYYNKARATLGQAAYAASTFFFVLASVASMLFLLEAANFPIVRLVLEQFAGVVGLSSWRTLISALTAYCIGYFVLTTVLTLDIDTIRDTLKRWIPRIQGTRLDNFLYDISRKQHRSERAYSPPLWKRLLWSAFLLVFWSLYLIGVFAALDASLQKHPEPNAERMLDVAVLLLEQAILYIPMVVYYAGWNFLDPQKLVLVDPVLLTTFRLIIGLLVIRRIYRLWAATASAKLKIKTSTERHATE